MNEQLGNYIMKLKLVIAGIGTMIISALGGHDEMLNILAFFVILDYSSGLIKSIVLKKTDSKVGYRGIFRKIGLFIPVMIANQMDTILNTDMFRNMAIMFYIANEGISIIENLGSMGIPLPAFIEDTLVQLQESNNKEW